MDLPLIKIINSGNLSTIQGACRLGFQDYGEQSYMNGYDDADRKWRKNYTKLRREKNQLDILYKMTVLQLQTTNSLNQVVNKLYVCELI